MRTQKSLSISLLAVSWFMLLADSPSFAATVMVMDPSKAFTGDATLPEMNPMNNVEESSVVESEAESPSASAMPAIAKEPTRSLASIEERPTGSATREALKDSEKYIDMSFEDFVLKIQGMDSKALSQIEEELVLAEVAAGERKNSVSVREMNDRIVGAKNAVSAAKQSGDKGAEALALADLRKLELNKERIEDLQRGGGAESKIRSFANLTRAVSKSPESFEKDSCSVLVENSSVRSSLSKSQQESLCKDSSLKEKLFAKADSGSVATVRRSFANPEGASLSREHSSEPGSVNREPAVNSAASNAPAVNPANFQPQNFNEYFMQQAQMQQLQAGQMQMMRGQQIYESCMGEIANTMAVAPIKDVQKRIEPMIAALRAKSGSSLHSELLAMIPDAAVSEMGVFGLEQDAANVVKSIPNSVEDNKSLREQLKIIEGINAATTRALEAVRSEMAGLPPPSTKDQMDEMRKLDAKRVELLKSQNAAMALIPAIRAELNERRSLVNSAFRPLGQGGLVVPRVGAPK